MAVYYHIYNRTSDVIMDIFDERMYPLGVILCFLSAITLLTISRPFFIPRRSFPPVKLRNKSLITELFIALCGLSSTQPNCHPNVP